MQLTGDWLIRPIGTENFHWLFDMTTGNPETALWIAPLVREHLDDAEILELLAEASKQIVYGSQNPVILTPQHGDCAGGCGIQPERVSVLIPVGSHLPDGDSEPIISIDALAFEDTPIW